MAISEVDIRRWHDLAAIVASSESELNTSEVQYIRYFEDIYYYFARDTYPCDDINGARKALAKRSGNLSSSKPLKGHLKDFLSITSNVVRTEENYRQFRAGLKAKGWLPPARESKEGKKKVFDEDELLRRAAEERARREREDRERQRRKQAEEERRRREAERQERERMERWQREREMEARRRKEKALRRKRIVLGCVAAVGLVVGLAFGIPYYIHNVVEYNELLRESDRLVTEYKFDEAISLVKEARELKSSASAKSELNTKIHNISAKKNAKIQTLRTDINKVWSAYFSEKNLKTSVLRYVSKTEIEPVIKAQEENIRLLNSIVGNKSEFDGNMLKLNKLKRYYKL